MELILAGVLLMAVISDMRTRRIPNWLTFGAALAGTALQAWFGGLGAMSLALAGLAVGLGCFLPSYLFGALGGGDVKLMAATGTFLGPAAAVTAALAAVVAGGVLALARITWRGGFTRMAMRYGTMLMAFVSMRRLIYVAPAKDEPAAERFPYALAIAAGAAVAMNWDGWMR